MNIEPNIKNREFYLTNNLDVMRGINTGTVKVIATDPPFKTDKAWASTPSDMKSRSSGRFDDRWPWIVDLDATALWLQSNAPGVWRFIEYAYEYWGESMGSFLTYMGVRAVEMHRILRDDGTLYWHCDPKASHYIKIILDAIFGKGNFRNEIVWHYGKWSNVTRGFQSNHDIILRYTKSDDFTFNPIYVSRRKIGSYDTNRVDGVTQLSIYDRQNVPDSVLRKHEREGSVIVEVSKPGAPEHDVWTYVRSSELNILNSRSKERVGFPTQKPITLYKRLICTASNEGDLVLDPFAGSATTPIAAEASGRSWVGIDIWPDAHAMVVRRLKDAGYSVSVDKLREAPTRSDGVLVTDKLIQAANELRRSGPGKPDSRETRKIKTELLAGHSFFTCKGCNYRHPDAMATLDHDRPLMHGGKTTLENSRLLCLPCNESKGSNLTLDALIDFNKQHGLYFEPKTLPMTWEIE